METGIHWGGTLASTRLSHELLVNTPEQIINIQVDPVPVALGNSVRSLAKTSLRWLLKAELAPPNQT
jgi:hypothetical protein